MSAAKSFDRSFLENPPVQDFPAKGGLNQPGSEINEIRYLRPDELGLWDEFVNASPQGSLFTRSWWLHAVGDDTRVLAYFKTGRIIAGIPLHFEKRWGLRFCRMPQLTPIWGLLLPPLTGKKAKIASEEDQILGTMAKALKKETFFSQTFHSEFNNWLPFSWEGYGQRTRYTYRLSVQELDQVWQEMAQNVRKQINSAKRIGITVVPCGPEQVSKLEQETFRRQGLRMPHTSEYLNRLYSAAKERDSGECLAAVDPAGNVHSAAFFVWDAQTTSALALGNSIEFRNSGAASLIHWHMIQCAAERSKTYDFCGSNIEGIERFIRSFGGSRVPYYQITRFPWPLRAYLSCIGKI